MATHRIRSIDIFRGFTIFVMVFVNDLAGVKNIPAWMKHAGAYDDTMTFVDVVFPAFLFIVGMAIPFAIQHRQKRKEPLLQILFHVATRTFGLLVLGVFMVNAAEMNAAATAIPKSVWTLLMYGSAILIWNQYPHSTDHRKYIFQGLKVLGVIILIFLWYVYRKGEEGETMMTPSWWGILGLIGWAYILSVIVYLITQKNKAALVGIFALFICIAIGLGQEKLALPIGLHWLRGEGGHFVHATICLSGTFLGVIFQQRLGFRANLKNILLLSLLFFMAGYFLRPLYGLSKILATPTWGLYCASICCIVFLLIHYISDVRGKQQWANFLTPAGKNPLLTYILPSIFYAALGYGLWPVWLNSGAGGILRSIIFSFFILAIAAVLSRWKIRLHL